VGRVLDCDGKRCHWSIGLAWGKVKVTRPGVSLLFSIVSFLSFFAGRVILTLTSWPILRQTVGQCCLALSCPWCFRTFWPRKTELGCRHCVAECINFRFGYLIVSYRKLRVSSASRAGLLAPVLFSPFSLLPSPFSLLPSPPSHHTLSRCFESCFAWNVGVHHKAGMQLPPFAHGSSLVCRLLGGRGTHYGGLFGPGLLPFSRWSWALELLVHTCRYPSVGSWLLGEKVKTPKRNRI